MRIIKPDESQLHIPDRRRTSPHTSKIHERSHYSNNRNAENKPHNHKNHPQNNGFDWLRFSPKATPAPISHANPTSKQNKFA
jgi:hypothetical protein